MGYTTHKAEGEIPVEQSTGEASGTRCNSSHPHPKKMKSAGTDAKSHLRNHTLPDQGEKGSGLPK